MRRSRLWLLVLAVVVGTVSMSIGLGGLTERPVLAQGLVEYFFGVSLVSARQPVIVSDVGATYQSRITCTPNQAPAPGGVGLNCIGFASLYIPGTGRFDFRYSGAPIAGGLGFSGTVLGRGGTIPFTEIITILDPLPLPDLEPGLEGYPVEVTLKRCITFNGTTIVINDHQATLSILAIPIPEP